MFANSRLTRRMVSLNARPAHLVGPMLGWCWGRCRTFLEYGPLAPIAAPAEHGLSWSANAERQPNGYPDPEGH
jgi:hypothetical protein